MQFGLSGCTGGFESAKPEELACLAQSAEARGFDGIWINEEHFQAPSDGIGRLCLSPVVLAATLAAHTRRIRIGFSVLLLPLHHPLRLAEEIATLDYLSGGRIDLGLSRGGNAGYSAAYGVDPARGKERFCDQLDFMRRCWDKAGVEVDGQVYSVQPKPIQQPGPPVYIGTYSEDMARWAARAGHLLIQHGIQSLANVRKILGAYGSEGGDVTTVPVGRFVYVGERDDSVRQELEPVIQRLTARLKQAGIPKRHGTLAEEDLDPDRFYKDMVIAGSPETCLEMIQSLRDLTGVHYLNLLSAFFGFLPAAHLKRSLGLFAAEVMPKLRDR